MTNLNKNNPFQKIAASVANAARSVWSFYYDGFRSMTVGKKLWALIIIKLFLFFVVLKLFFFPNILKRDFDTDEERATHVRQVLGSQREPEHSLPVADRSSDEEGSDAGLIRPEDGSGSVASPSRE